ncbi:branched-chain amino acid ABC transporter permease [Variovorax guangxiensis]|uniref:branched-chain amino acid ABC transporter permease n=1 Tax=Variovorax guangxiensis TaxID=1775474 RepID=UPI002860291F|nr:branched-chain amino acid ABC transporter permease [Variovorax guangxiensis]MDR6857636.1 branched-chain amino acid transport system permease protein [Variovorax guangxiensis]
MNASAAAAGAARGARGPGIVRPVAAPGPVSTQSPAGWTRRLSALLRAVRARHVLVALFVLAYPFFATPFFTFQIGAQSLALGLIALSLTFLGGYGGMVSLAQMTVAGFAAYMLAIFGTSSNVAISLGWPWWLALAVALSLATLFAAAVGWLSVRTEGIYTIMITLAVGVAFFYLAQQNYTVFNGFQGFSRIAPPTLFELDLREPMPFYFLALACALAGYFFIKHLVRAPFGIALQGIRDNPRRMQALGYNLTAHRVAAYAVAGLLAAVGGVLMVWYNGRISPGTVGTGAMINILIIAVLGGMKHPIGAFVGAIVFVLLQNFAIDLVDRERFNLVIGGVFLAIVLFSPDGLLGLWQSLRARLPGPFTSRGRGRISSMTTRSET